eukprot:7346939-Pyramimonas_sp.AAC.1
MSRLATSSKRKNQVHMIPQSADRQTAKQKLVPSFLSGARARPCIASSWRLSEDVRASKVATASGISAIFPAGPA